MISYRNLPSINIFLIVCIFFRRYQWGVTCEFTCVLLWPAFAFDTFSSPSSSSASSLLPPTLAVCCCLFVAAVVAVVVFVVLVVAGFFFFFYSCCLLLLLWLLLQVSVPLFSSRVLSLGLGLGSDRSVADFARQRAVCTAISLYFHLYIFSTVLFLVFSRTWFFRCSCARALISVFCFCEWRRRRSGVYCVCV